jgi:putative oxidoreductase
VEEWGNNLLLWARIVTGGAFLIIGWRNIDNQKLIADMIRGQKLPFAGVLAWAGIGMQIVFGALMLTTWQPAVAAIGLFVFVILATLIAHRFWNIDDKELRKIDASAFLANAIMAGGLLALAAAGL